MTAASFVATALFGADAIKVRTLLYVSARVASRHNPILKKLYQRLLVAEKPKKLALTAFMRKLIILANRLLRQLLTPFLIYLQLEGGLIANSQGNAP